MIRLWRSLLVCVVGIAASGSMKPVEASPPESPRAERIRVAVFTGAGASRRSVANLMRVLDGFPDELAVERVGADDIRSGRLAGFDVVVHPGGSGSGQGRALGAEGREVVRRFVADGGGYLGICAGAYLASRDYKWSLGLLDAKVVDKAHWARGYGEVRLRLRAEGCRLLGAGDAVTINYHQGPLLAPADDEAIPDYRELASFASEVRRQGVPGGVMVGTTAAAAGTFGAGRVFCFSPHPEKTPGLEAWLLRSLEWTAGRRGKRLGDAAAEPAVAESSPHPNVR
jgi:putative intracellular protease/amidase